MQNGCAIATKTHSDHESDITRGLEFKVCAHLMKNTEKTASSARRITILAGEGIGTVVRDGLEVKKGSSAINPVPMRQIHDAVMEALDEMGSEMGSEIGFEDVEVTVSVPKGVEVGKKTLNSRIGVEGGISILGTTGFVEPWNDHFGETKEILTKEATKVVITTGRLGMRYSTMLFPNHTIVIFGSRISEGLEAASGNVEEIVVCGLPGLVLKWGNPDILKDSGFATVSDMMTNYPGNERLTSAFEQNVKKANSARIVIIDRSGAVLMDSGGCNDNCWSWRWTKICSHRKLSKRFEVLLLFMAPSARLNLHPNSLNAKLARSRITKPCIYYQKTRSCFPQATPCFQDLANSQARRIRSFPVYHPFRSHVPVWE